MESLTFDTKTTSLFSLGALLGAGISVGFLACRCIRRWGKKEIKLNHSQERIIERVNIISDEILKRRSWGIHLPFVTPGDKRLVDAMYTELMHVWPDTLASRLVNKLAEPAFQGNDGVLLDVLKRLVHDSDLPRDVVQKLSPSLNKLLTIVIKEPITGLDKVKLASVFPSTY